MKYIDGFRNADAAKYLRDRIAEANQPLRQQGRVLRVMEVCGTHTMAIARHGIRSVLPENVTLLSGPGCPVCVTHAGYIDAALQLAKQGVIVASFGDMLKVPGSSDTLAGARSQGARVEVCYSPEMAVELAQRHPRSQVVFLGIGFETTIAPVISIIRSAAERTLENLSVLTAFKLVPPALRALVADPEVKVDAFICPAHVSAVIGSEAYRPFVEEQHIPCVVAGFEPLDILHGIANLVEQLAEDRAELVNQYDRVVKPFGNRRAIDLMEKYLQPVDASWRGIGVIPSSGLALKQDYREFDAARRFGVSIDTGWSHPACRCGDVLKGKIQPQDCALFGSGCTPDHPIGPCMVSSEGSCAAHYAFNRFTESTASGGRR